MIIDWKKIASKMYEEMKSQISKMSKTPSLGAILVWNNSSSLRYINEKKKWADYLWIDFKLFNLSESTNESDLLSFIKKLNQDDSIDWYIVQLPLPSHINPKKIINCIDPKKDVDWFHPENQWKLIIWDDSWLVSCTPAWIIKILNSLKIDFEWKVVTVLWRSNIVWKPISLMLINLWATVISCNSKTKNLKSYTEKSDIVISAVWKPGFLRLDMINTSTIVIDVWFTVVWDKVYWDADFENINLVWNKITPVPGWVWSLTVAMLMSNTIKAYLAKNK